MLSGVIGQAGFMRSGLSSSNLDKLITKLFSDKKAPAVALKTKSNSGLVRSVSLQKEGYVQASVSAGNSGAMMAACLMLLGRVGGVARPAITCLMPCMNEKVVLLDLILSQQTHL